LIQKLEVWGKEKRICHSFK